MKVFDAIYAMSNIISLSDYQFIIRFGNYNISKFTKFPILKYESL